MKLKKPKTVAQVEMISVTLKKAFSPNYSFPLVRLGRENDGGYMVDPRSVAAADRLLSLGLNDDWSFERAFRTKNEVKIDVFDGNVDTNFFLKNIWKAIPQIKEPSKLWRSIKSPLDYRKFFKGTVKHHSLMIGYNAKKSLQLSKAVDQYFSLRNEKIFAKIDIEGWEYRILEDLLNLAPRLTGLVIEFHDLDLHENIVLDFIERLPMEICYCKPNNSGGRAEDGTPIVIEMSFSAFSADSQSSFQKHPLDMQNDPKQPNFEIFFTN